MKTVRLTESDLNRIVRRVISEGTGVYFLDKVTSPIKGNFEIDYNPQSKVIRIMTPQGNEYQGTIAPTKITTQTPTTTKP